MRIEPERTGSARIYDLVREFDKNRIVDNKEDIDTLLVFVSPWSYPDLACYKLLRKGWFILCGRHRIHHRVVQEPPTAA